MLLPMKKSSMLINNLALGAVFVCLTSCETFSISNTGNNRMYGGELSEFDVLGIGAGDKPRARSGARRPARGGRILLVQSGATIPDAALEQAFSQHYSIVPFNGSGSSRYHNGNVKDPAINGKLRTAAASAGASHVVCVWGVVEAEREEHVTKAVSWVPVLGQIVPDESSHMRTSLKAASVNASTGAWDAVSAYTPVTTMRGSSGLTRSSLRTLQIEKAKKKGYADLANKLAES